VSEKLDEARAQCKLHVAISLVLVALDAVALVCLDAEPWRSLALVALGWLLSGLWKLLQMIETIDNQREDEQ
jgi:hypothetical protein